MSKKVAILQSNYIPWKGYFDLINQVDEFIIYDTVQYTKNDWRNRNKIMTKNGLLWLTIPVTVKNLSQKICETKISSNNWNIKHCKTIIQNYSKSPFFKDYSEIVKELYCNCKYRYLSEINYYFIVAINELIGIETKVSWSSDYNILGGKTERLVNICKQAKASEYISGPAALDYIDQPLFTNENIKLTWMDYSHYDEYQQLGSGFSHQVSIFDLLFNLGFNVKQYLNQSLK